MTKLVLTILMFAIVLMAGCSSDKDPLVFERIDVGVDETVTGIHFMSGNEGCLVTTAGNIYRTNDAGKTFSKVGTSDGKRLVDVYFFEDKLGFAYGERGAMLRSTDDGMTWSMVALDSALSISGIAFPDEELGIVSANRLENDSTQRSLIGISRDKGLNWSFESADYPRLGCVDAVPDNHAWILADGALVYTTDGGRSWETIAGQTPGLNALFFLDVQHGWEVGDNGVLRYSTDGGWSWQTKLKMTENNLSCIQVPEPDRVYIAGNRFLAASTDHGHRWIIDTLSHQVDFVDMHASEGNVYLVGSRGELIKLTY